MMMIIFWEMIIITYFFVYGYRASVRRSSDEPVRGEHPQQTVKYLSKNVLGFFFTASGPVSLVQFMA
jgi:hypothetical protein